MLREKRRAPLAKAFGDSAADENCGSIELLRIWAGSKLPPKMYRRSGAKSFDTNSILQADVRRSGELVRSHSRCQKLVCRPSSHKRIMWDLLSVLFMAYDLITIPLLLVGSQETAARAHARAPHRPSVHSAPNAFVCAPVSRSIGRSPIAAKLSRKSRLARNGPLLQAGGWLRSCIGPAAQSRGRRRQTDGMESGAEEGRLCRHKQIAWQGHGASARHGAFGHARVAKSPHRLAMP